MAGVPQKTLNWLYDVLRREYRDPNRTYSDLAQTLAQYPGFGPRTDVYTSENGIPALLLNFKGTLPVNFRGTVYRFPIAIWIPHAYPHEAPIVYVTPTEDMIVRQGQHVSGADGKVYHHYLSQWSQAWDRSSVVGFLRILADVFAREPPVMAKPSAGIPQQRPAQHKGPPLPAHHSTYAQQRSQTQDSYGTNQPGPPPPPPKPGLAGPDGSRPPSTIPVSPPPRPNRYDAPPPIPPPNQQQAPTSRPQGVYNNSHMQHTPGGMQYMPQRQNTPGHQGPPGQPISQQYRVQSPAGPISSPPPAHPPAQQNYSQSGQGLQHAPQSYQQQYQQPAHQYQAPQQPHPYGQPNAQLGYKTQPSSVQQKPAAPKDLLTEEDPFQVALPTAPRQQVQSSIPAPPIPENPEKTALLSHISHQILQHLHQSINQTATTALPSLYSQHAALMAAQQTLNTELSQLQSLSSQLNSNISSLQSTISSANKTISSTTSPSSSSNPSNIPSVDEIIIPPSVIARQLYDNVAEQRGYEAAIYALNEAFVRGRIGAEVWGRKCREMAREDFRRKWMIKRIGTGLGLEESA